MFFSYNFFYIFLYCCLLIMFVFSSDQRKIIVRSVNLTCVSPYISVIQRTFSILVKIWYFLGAKTLVCGLLKFYGVTSPEWIAIDEFLLEKMLSSDFTFVQDQKSLIPVALEIYRSIYLPIYRSTDLPIYLYSCNIGPI